MNYLPRARRFLLAFFGLWFFTSVAQANEDLLRLINRGDVAGIQAALAKTKIDLNAELFPDYSYLDAAAEAYDPSMPAPAAERARKVYEYLIKRGARPQVWAAARMGDGKRFLELYPGVSDPNLQNGVGRSLVQAACASASLDILKRLAADGAELAYVDLESKTALHWAAEANAMDCVAFLLDSGLSPAALDGDGRSPAQLARAKGLGKMADFLDSLR